MVLLQVPRVFQTNEMTIKLDEKWSRKLAELPESSMGSQHVDIFLRGNRVIRDVPVFNAEECHSPESFDPNDVLDVRPHHNK
jgi:hypothetical protein